MNSVEYGFRNDTERIASNMVKKNFKEQCSDLTKEFNIQIPCRLAERVEAYAKENDADIAGVVIEALDTFLREQKSK
jgi:transposase